MRRRMYRSRTDRMLFGVAGGMADWLDLDPSIVRLVWALLILAGGVGILLYIVAALVVPEAPFGYGATSGDAAPGSSPAAPPARGERGRDAGNGGVILGIILVAVGAWFLIDRYVDIDTSWLVPGILIVVGVALVLGALGRSRDDGPA